VYFVVLHYTIVPQCNTKFAKTWNLILSTVYITYNLHHI